MRLVRRHIPAEWYPFCMSIVVPAILPKSAEDLNEKLARLVPFPEIDFVQVDVVDGVFATPPTWPYVSGAPYELPRQERFRYDLDLMIAKPEEEVDKWIAAGASRVTIHYESAHDLPTLIGHIKHVHGHEANFAPDLLAIGVAINIGTDISVLESCIEQFDYVQCMGIATIGRQGEPFDERVLAKVKEIRARYPKIPVQVDGGVSLISAQKLLEAGVTRLIVGSALMKAADVASELVKFKALGEEHGIYE